MELNSFDVDNHNKTWMEETINKTDWRNFKMGQRNIKAKRKKGAYIRKITKHWLWQTSTKAREIKTNQMLETKAAQSTSVQFTIKIQHLSANNKRNGRRTRRELEVNNTGTDG